MNLSQLKKDIAKLRQEMPAPELDEAALTVRALLETDYRIWLTRLLPLHFRSLDDFAGHHNDFWNWVWSLQRGIKPPAFLAIWNRGGMKSTSAEASCVVVGATGRRKYALYVCETQDQADKHVATVGRMLAVSEVGSYYPDLARPEVRYVGNAKIQMAWRRNRLWTAGGFVIDAYGLDSALRGVKLDADRPDYIILDDIDNEKDSPLVIESKIERLTGALLPAGSEDSAVLFAQNLIHRDSVLSRLHDGRAEFLTEHIKSGPIPAVRNPVYERRERRWFIVSGEPAWRGMNLQKCQQKLNEWGKRKWDIEAQHEVGTPYQGAVYPAFDPVYHVITWSEFARYFEAIGVECRDQAGRPKLPKRGHCAVAQDFGTTLAHPCVTKWVWRPAEGMRLTDSVFFYREMVWPAFPPQEDDPRRIVSPGKVALAILERERPWEESSRMLFRLASHEQKAVRNAYLLDMPPGYDPLMFEAIDTEQAKEGIHLIQNFLEVDQEEMHPFRVYPGGHPQAGEPLRGRPRLYLVVAGGQGELSWENGRLQVKEAINEAGFARTRYEFPLYRYPENAQGIEANKPFKMNDDAMDADRAIAGRLFPFVQELTPRERMALRYQERMQVINQTVDPAARVYAEMTLMYNLAAERRREERRSRGYLGQLDGWDEDDQPPRYYGYGAIEDEDE